MSYKYLFNSKEISKKEQTLIKTKKINVLVVDSVKLKLLPGFEYRFKNEGVVNAALYVKYTADKKIRNVIPKFKELYDKYNLASNFIFISSIPIPKTIKKNQVVNNYGVLASLGKSSDDYFKSATKTILDRLVDQSFKASHESIKLLEAMSRNHHLLAKNGVNLYGLARSKINKILGATDDGFYIAEIEILEDELEEQSTLTANAILREQRTYSQLLIDQLNIESDEQDEIVSLESFYPKTDLKALDFSYHAFYPIVKTGIFYDSFITDILKINNPKTRIIEVISYLKYYADHNKLDEKIQAEVKKSVENNQKEYYINEQIKALRKELNKNDDENEENQLLEDIKASGMPPAVMEKALNELRKYRNMSSLNSEGYSLRNYIEWLINVPWVGDEIPAPSVEKAEQIINQSHYGLEKVKQKILEYVAVLSRGDISKAPIICLIGPPGVGKTSLASSIAQALNRRFTRLSLGGIDDESEIRGHRRTYVGAMPGKIIQWLTKVGVNNPLFLLDEIDKLAYSNHGDPAAALLEVLDPEQNKAFNDHFIELDYDLSKVLFVATANSYNIPEPLLDRMEVIDLNSYTLEEKFAIAKNHILDKVLRNNLAKPKEIIISDAILKYIINGYTLEPGVRNLEKRLQSIVRYIIKDITVTKAKSVKVTEKLVTKILGPRIIELENRQKEKPQIGEISGLAYTTVGGSILQIEVATMPGKGNVYSTGSLGDNIKESVNYAISAIRTRAQKLNIDPNFYTTTDIHVHFPEAATKKDGPSAGAAITTAIISSLTEREIPSFIGMTGEISLRGKVLKIGGIKEKSMAAYRNGITHVIIPKSNLPDLHEIPQEIRQKLAFYPVEHLDDILPMVFEGKFQGKEYKPKEL